MIFQQVQLHTSVKCNRSICISIYNTSCCNCIDRRRSEVSEKITIYIHHFQSHQHARGKLQQEKKKAKNYNKQKTGAGEEVVATGNMCGRDAVLGRCILHALYIYECRTLECLMELKCMVIVLQAYHIFKNISDEKYTWGNQSI